MYQPDMVQELLPQFAFTCGKNSTGCDDYKKRLSQLSKTDFADELVLAATAVKLRIAIVVVPPYQDRILRTHPDPSRHAALGVDDKDVIYLGSLSSLL